MTKPAISRLLFTALLGLVLIACEGQRLPRSTESMVSESSKLPHQLPTNTPVTPTSPGPVRTPAPDGSGSAAGEEIDSGVIAAQVKLISDGFISGDLSIFRELAYDSIGYGYYKSEIWDYFSKSEFLEEVSMRLAVLPVCASYSYVVYNPGPDSFDVVIYIFTEDWEPEWDLDDIRKSDRVVFELNSGDGEQFDLIGAYLNPAPTFVGDFACP